MGSLPTGMGARVVLSDPTEPKRVYALGDSGLYRSDDAGESWKPASQGLPDAGIVALALDPQQPARLYAATSAGAIYLSDDGARSWRTLSENARAN